MLQAANKTQDMLNDTPVDKPYVMPRLKTVLLLEEDITVQLIRREKAKLRAKKNLVAACQRHADAFWKMHMCSWKRQRKLFYAYGPAW